MTEDIYLPFNHRIEPLLQDGIDYVLVRANNLRKAQLMIKLCEKYGYKAETLDTGLFRLVKKYRHD